MKYYDDNCDERLTLRKAYERYYHEWSPDLEPASKARNLYDLARWERFMGDVPVVELTTEHYQRFRALSAKDIEMAAETCETTLRTIRAIMRMCHAYRIIRVVPDCGKPRKVQKKKPHVLTVFELGRLYEQSENMNWPKSPVPPETWWKSAIALAVWTGFRRTNFFWSLRWEHVRYDTEIPRIEFQATKTGKVHAVPLVPIMIRHLAALKAPLANPIGPVFNTPSNIRDLRGRLKLLSSRAEIHPHVTPQTLRRTGISLWRNADSHAGCVIHGQGMPSVLTHYLDFVKVLENVMEDVELPKQFYQFTTVDKQLAFDF